MSLKELNQTLEKVQKFVDSFDIEKATEETETEVVELIGKLTETEPLLFNANDELTEKLQGFIFELGLKDFSEKEEDKKER